MKNQKLHNPGALSAGWLNFPVKSHILSIRRAYYGRKQEQTEGESMEKTIQHTHAGWRQEETDLLWQEIRSATESGQPLRGVFERMGQALGRKPNSVRNYYYLHFRDCPDESLRRAAPFETFTEEEIHQLLRRVLMARGQGKSVRACVMDMSGGDRALMLRYQNKYRSILRKKPDLIEQTCRELQQEGLPCPALTVTVRETPLAAPAAPDDPDVKRILDALSSLSRRANAVPENDRLRVQRDLLLMQVEDLQMASRALIACCKDFLGAAPEDRPPLLPAFSAALAGHVAQLESISG